MTRNPDAPITIQPAATPPRRRWLSVLDRQAVYPNAYVWFVFVSVMDVIMTTLVLHFGGREANPIAETILAGAGLRGLMLFKFAMVMLVIGCCQAIGERRYRTGRRVIYFAVGVTAVPMILAFAQLLMATPEGLIG
jgi:hypothetical protein